MTPGSVPSPQGPGPAGLLLSRDLIFTSKVTGTARALGREVLVAGNSALAAAMVAQWAPKVVFVDLAAGELASPAAIVALREACEPGTPFVAFGSHVDTDALEAARAVGCEAVMPRSRFSAELPDLVRRYLGAPGESYPIS